MRSGVLFVLGLIVGIVATQPGAAQVDSNTGLNHVAFSVDDFDAALDFYTETMGFREVGPIRNDDGEVLFTYVQVNRDTFIELFPPSPAGGTGFTHIGLSVDDLDGAIAELRASGVEVGDPITGRTRAYLANATGPDGVRIELLELSPGSIQREAVDSWPGR